VPPGVGPPAVWPDPVPALGVEPRRVPARFLIKAVGRDSAKLVPEPFVARTTRRMWCPTSAVLSLYVRPPYARRLVVVMTLQRRAAALHRSQR
jgi:hypothetical protein